MLAWGRIAWSASAPDLRVVCGGVAVNVQRSEAVAKLLLEDNAFEPGFDTTAPHAVSTMVLKCASVVAVNQQQPRSPFPEDALRGEHTYVGTGWSSVMATCHHAGLAACTRTGCWTCRHHWTALQTYKSSPSWIRCLL